MNESRSQPPNHAFGNVMFAIAIAIIAAGAIKHVSYRNQQIKTVRDIAAAEKSIQSLQQDRIPSVQAEIEQQLARYDIREKLKANGTDLVPTPPNCVEVIRLKAPSLSLQSNRP